MTLPVLSYPLSSQNQRVNSYEILGDEQPRIYTTDNCPTDIELDEIIWASYRQVFNEQQIISYHRQFFLESQLRNGQISVRDFIKGLALSDSFRRLNYESNNNYRFAEMCIQRFLGRQVYNEREKLAWSIVLATKGLRGFINELIETEEYLDNFGDSTVPYQRQRILPQRSLGELPFARMSRYDESYLKTLQRRGQLRTFGNGVIDRSAGVYSKVLLLVPTIAILLLISIIAIAATS